MRALLPAAVLTGGTLLACPVASASPVDDMTDDQKAIVLVQVLKNQGFSAASADDVKQLGQAMCVSLATGRPRSMVVADLESMNPAWTYSQVHFFFGAAAEAFCPDENPFHMSET
jgi:hypothetical protein